VMTPALIRGPPFENLAKSIENFGSPSRLLGHEIIDIFHHKLEIYLVFLSTPPSYLYFLFIDLQT